MFQFNLRLDPEIIEDLNLNEDTVIEAYFDIFRRNINMKKFIRNMSNKLSAAVSKATMKAAEFHRRALTGNAGEGYIDTAVKILIAVVLGALLLALLYALFNDTIMPTVTQKIKDMFNYAGSLS